MTAGARLERDGVEGVPGGFDADAADDVVQPAVTQGESIDERLGDRLNRERHPTVTHGVAVTVHGCHGDTEGVRIGVGQLRDVTGNGPIAAMAEPTVDLAEQPFDRTTPWCPVTEVSGAVV